jgi:hypothetical protein
VTGDEYKQIIAHFVYEYNFLTKFSPSFIYVGNAPVWKKNHGRIKNSSAMFVANKQEAIEDKLLSDH